METIKRFAFNSTTSSLNERNSLFNELFDVLNSQKKDDLPEMVYKALGKLNYYLFPRYLDKTSKKYLITLNDLIIKINADNSIKSIIQSYETHSNACVLTQSNHGLSILSLKAVDIINGLFISLNNHKKDMIDSDSFDFVSLTQTYSRFLLTSVNFDLEKPFELGYAKFKFLTNQIKGITTKFEEVLKKILNDSAESINYLLFGGFLMKYLKDTNNSNFNSLKSLLLEIYTKHVIGSRVKLPVSMVKSCNYWIRYLEKDEFKEKILPALQRALLRNPEIVLEVSRFIFEDLNIELSDFAKEILTSLNSQLIAKDESVQNESALAVKFLSKQCTSNDSIQLILKNLFDILNGSQGKLSTINQKMSVLTAIGNCSFNFCFSNSDVLKFFIENIGDFLKSETHEATQLFCLEQLSICFRNLQTSSFSTVFLTKLKEFFKKLLDDKSNTPLLRTQVYYAMASIYSINTISQDIQHFHSNCIQSIDKSFAQTTQNNTINCEALSASLLLAIHLESDNSIEAKVTNFINATNDTKKQLFTNEKFYSSLNELGTKAYCELFGKLVLINISKEIFDFKPYLNGFIFCLLHSNYKIRKNAQNILKKLRIEEPKRLLIPLIDSVTTLCESLNLLETADNILKKEEANGTSDSNDSNSKWPSPKGFCELINCITTFNNLSEEYFQMIVLKSLILCNSPLAKHIDTTLFEKFLKRLLASNMQINRSVSEIFSMLNDNLVTLTTNKTVLSQSQLNSILVLVKLDSRNYLNKIVQFSLKLLTDSPDLYNVTKEKFDIMNLSDSELYDKSLIESTIKQINDSKLDTNLKKESKAYSYKEQIAEIELRKELEQSKGGSKKKTEEVNYSLSEIRSKMSKKQQEQLDNQIAKEKAIREEMKKLELIVYKATSILNKVIEGNLTESSNHFALIFSILASFIKSPICVQYIYQVYEKTAKEISEQNKNSTNYLFSFNFLKSVIVCFIRLSKTLFSFESCWLQEPLNVLTNRLNKILKNQVELAIKENCFDLSLCSYFYPFFKYNIFESTLSEESLKNLVDTILIFSKYRNKLQDDLFSNEESATTENENKIIKLTCNFPSSEFFCLMINIINLVNDKKLNTNIQYQASEVCKSIFQFSSKLIFKASNCSNYVFNNLEIMTKSYNLEILEIISALNSPVFVARETSLVCLNNLLNEKNNFSTNKINCDRFFLTDSVYEKLNHVLWLACFDAEKPNRILAGKIWDQSTFLINKELCYLLAEDVVHPVDIIRNSAAEALSDAIKKNQSILSGVLKTLITKYEILAVVKEPKKDQFGRVSNETIIDEWESRAGIANAIAHLAENVPTDFVLELFTFFVYKSLNDKNELVKNKMLEASIAALNFHGRSHINVLLPLFEKYLEEAPKLAAYDSVRQNVVILMGTLAKHLDKNDAKVGPIIDKLIQALQTPSQQVQEAVANCLPPLVPSIKTEVPNYVNKLLNALLISETYGQRRGAAYGLAGLLKGVGMLSLRQLNVLQRLNEAVNNKSDAKQREGALLAYEMLTIMFNKVFEPYSVEILPNLLLCFGDADANVRQAADDCAKAVMSNLTFTGVKMILPKLLERLGEDESWRTKCGSVELLGAMAHCAPKQLSTCLPNIVPKLIEILSDSHVKVQRAGTQALRQIGSVIKNPEIQAITNVLLEALQDPALKTQKALQVLLDTKFIHFIDAPSLALIMPVVQRAFQDRSTEIRKMAAQIMGNMYSLTDQKDLLPYLPAILPGLKLSLLDPVPDVRSVSSKALGAMIRAIGENGLNDIISWLMEKLVSETSAVDRSGAAQGLSEVFGALGSAKLEKSMPEIIERAIQLDLSPYVRDGYIMMFIYLPLTFGEEFIPYIGQIIQPILKALADDCEFVRDTAIKAGQRIVNTYAETAISLFLPELEKGLFDSNWRIRYSSVQLLGDLLYKISGVVGKMTTESAHEDDNFGTEKGSAAIIKALGEDRRNRVYSGLYMGRSDVSLQVRQSALHVWKIIVSNTPKTLREILPTLFVILLGCLASSNYEKRHIAASTLVDIVRKLGERVLPDIIPILENGLNSERSEQRQGVCIGLTEIMANTSRDNILTFSDSLVPTVRKALMDPLAEVRYCAAKTFDNLHNMIGVKALDEVALFLLDEMKKENGEKSEWATDGLKQVMLVKSRVLLPYIVPYLIQPPVNINALCKLCSCASVEVLSRHLSKILVTLINSLALTESNQNHSWINECELLLLSINDAEGIRTIVNELMTHATVDEKISTKSSALDMLFWFCSKTKADYSYHVDELVRGLMILLNDKNESILIKSWDCLNSIIEQLKGNNLLNRLGTIRQSVRMLTQQNPQLRSQYVYTPLENSKTEDKANYLPGFCLPKKGLSCILPIFKEGLLNGSPDMKEQSAQTLCECIKLSDGVSLKSSVMAITGPLIRVLGERYSWSVKSAVLDAIYFLLLKVDVTLKPFLPQLQPTFMKNLNDINKIVRLKSGYALSKLLFMNPKLDQVIIDIHNYIKNSEDLQVKETLLNTLRLCLNNVGDKVQEETKKQLFATLKTENYIYNEDSMIRSVSSGAIGSLAAFLNDPDFDVLLNDILDFSKYSGQNWKYLQANCMVLATILQHKPTRLIGSKYDRKYLSFITSCISSEKTQVCKSAIRVVGYYLDHTIKHDIKVENEYVSVLAKCINYNSNEVKQLAVDVLIYLCLNSKKVFEPYLLKIFIPMLMNGTREKDQSVRLNSEIALVKIIRLKETDSAFNNCLVLMENMKDSFQDCIKSLSKESFTQNLRLETYLFDETILRIEV